MEERIVYTRVDHVKLLGIPALSDEGLLHEVRIDQHGVGLANVLKSSRPKDGEGSGAA